jgi:protein MpaA
MRAPLIGVLLASVMSCMTGAMAASTPGDNSPQEYCLQFSQRLGSVFDSDCLAQSLQFSGHYSVEKRPILVRDFPAMDLASPRILVVGGIHGDELSSVSIVFGWMRGLQSSVAPRYHWRMTPSMNPDGLLQQNAERTNAHGVDLNRNFPTPNWQEESTHYWVQRTRRNPRRYPGPTPLSEPESRWLHAEIENFKPDAIVAIHAPFGIVDFDGPSTPPGSLGHLSLNLLGTYPGSLGNYAGVQQGIPVVTVELPSAGRMPSAAEQKKIWTDLVLWLDGHIRSQSQRAQLAPSTTVP